MSTAVQPLRPAGTPVGGQRTGIERAEADIELFDEPDFADDLHDDAAASDELADEPQLPTYDIAAVRSWRRAGTGVSGSP